MAGTSHQTIRIGRGKHRSPDHGACAMELASMLAGEKFSDSPECVDPVIAAFVRAFNDRLGHRRRQDLRPFAARVVGTHSTRAVQRKRRALCIEYASGAERIGSLRRARLALLLGVRAAVRLDVGAAEWAAREAVARGDENGGFELLQRLIAAGRSEPAPLPLTVVRRPDVGVPALAPEVVLEPHGPQEAQSGDRRDG